VNDTIAVDSGCGAETLNLGVKTKLIAVYGHSYIDIDNLVVANIDLSDCVDEF